MGIAVLFAVRIRVKGLLSSLFSKSAQFLFLSVFRAIIDLKKIVNLYMSWRRVRYISVAVENTTIGFKMREKPKLESDCFSVS